MQNNKTVQLQKPFHYIDVGKGEVLLLIHGWLGTKEDFEFNIDALAKKYRVITFDLPGNNGVKDLGPSDINGYIAFIREFLKATSLVTKKITIIGQSFGASIVLNYVNKYPQNIKKIVLFSLVLTQSNGQRKFLSKFLLRYKNTRILQFLIGKLKSSNFYIRYIVDLTCIKTSKNFKRIAEVTKEGLIKSTAKTYIEGYASLLTLESEKELKTLERSRIPYLIIYGDKDKVVSLNLLPKLTFLQNKIKMIKNANHSPNRDFPELFNKTVFTYLEK